jgi:hypothetical protein
MRAFRGGAGCWTDAASSREPARDAESTGATECRACSGRSSGSIWDGCCGFRNPRDARCDLDSGRDPRYCEDRGAGRDTHTVGPA